MIKKLTYLLICSLIFFSVPLFAARQILTLYLLNDTGQGLYLVGHDKSSGTGWRDGQHPPSVIRPDQQVKIAATNPNLLVTIRYSVKYSFTSGDKKNYCNVEVSARNETYPTATIKCYGKDSYSNSDMLAVQDQSSIVDISGGSIKVILSKKHNQVVH